MVSDAQLDVFVPGFLKRVGAPDNAVNQAAVRQWAKNEGVPDRLNNPLATTRNMPGHVVGNFNSVGVKLYDSIETGIEANARTVLQSPPLDYTSIVRALRTGDWSDRDALRFHFNRWCGCPAWYADAIIVAAIGAGAAPPAPANPFEHYPNVAQVLHLLYGPNTKWSGMTEQQAHAHFIAQAVANDVLMGNQIVQLQMQVAALYGLNGDSDVVQEAHSGEVDEHA